MKPPMIEFTEYGGMGAMVCTLSHIQKFLMANEIRMACCDPNSVLHLPDAGLVETRWSSGKFLALCWTDRSSIASYTEAVFTGFLPLNS